MLVHKKTMGVLDCFWSGTYSRCIGNARIPQMLEHTFDNTPGVDPSEWWCISSKSDLGRRLLRAYPCCDPIVDDDGSLVGITPWPEWLVSGVSTPDYEALPQKEQKRRHVRRRKGVLEALITSEQPEAKGE